MEEFEGAGREGICTVCVGFQDGDCYCQYFSTIHQGVNSTLKSDFDETSPSIKHYKRLKKDNIAHKRFSKLLQKIFFQITGKKITKDILTYYHRKDYFVLILSKMEEEGILDEAWKEFGSQVEKMTEKIDVELKDKPKQLAFLVEIADDHRKAFHHFMKGKVKKALEELFHPAVMRQKKNFRKSVSMIKEKRRTLGLPF